MFDNQYHRHIFTRGTYVGGTVILGKIEKDSEDFGSSVSFSYF